MDANTTILSLAHMLDEFLHRSQELREGVEWKVTHYTRQGIVQQPLLFGCFANAHNLVVRAGYTYTQCEMCSNGQRLVYFKGEGYDNYFAIQLSNVDQISGIVE